MTVANRDEQRPEPIEGGSGECRLQIRTGADTYVEVVAEFAQVAAACDVLAVFRPSRSPVPFSDVMGAQLYLALLSVGVNAPAMPGYARSAARALLGGAAPDARLVEVAQALFRVDPHHAALERSRHVGGEQ